MTRNLWNGLTKFSILGFALVIICLIFSVTGWLNEELSLYLRIFAIIVFVVSILIELYGVHRIRDYSKEDALEIYHRITQLIEELRTLAPILHADYEDIPEKYRRYTRDKRYMKLIEEFTQTKRQCIDHRLSRKLHILFEQEKLMAKYNLNPSEYKFQGALESVEQDISDYINTKLRNREGLKNS